MSRPIRNCPKCGERKKMEVHHVFPRKYWGRKGNDVTFMLCQLCHRELHTLLPEDKKLDEAQYVLILLCFLEEAQPP